MSQYNAELIKSNQIIFRTFEHAKIQQHFKDKRNSEEKEVNRINPANVSLKA